MNKKLIVLILGTFMLSGVHEANAWRYMTTDITDACSGYGYDLLPVYQTDSCNACHGDSQAKTAYDNSDYEYFCPAPSTTVCTDADGDGFYAEGDVCGTLADFNDNSSAAYPGAAENCTDGIDNDGNGLTDAADPNAIDCPAGCTDSDMDGYYAEGGECGAIDCNDDNASINPGAAEICTDAIDNNCNGLVDTADLNAVDCPVDCTDNDGDGYSIEGGNCGAMDCDDGNADVNPGALEICGDTIDNNCDGLVDQMDAVCQDDSVSDSSCETPWWRSRDKRQRDHKKSDPRCQTSDSGDSDDDESDDDESDNDRKGRRR